MYIIYSTVRTRLVRSQMAFALVLHTRYDVLLRGIIGTLTRHTICRERGLTLVPLSRSRAMPLLHRRLDGDIMVACREHVAVKIRWASEQTRNGRRTEVPPSNSKLHSKCDCIGMTAGGHGAHLDAFRTLWIHPGPPAHASTQYSSRARARWFYKAIGRRNVSYRS